MRVLELCEYQGNTVRVLGEYSESVGGIPLRMSEVYESTGGIG